MTPRLAIALLFLTRAVAAQDQIANARGPAFARDGRLVVSIDGDLWLRSGAQWTQLTRGSAWDRDPVWTPDGSAIVYTSNGSGNDDLWRLTLAQTAPRGAATQLTRTPDPDGEATVLANGNIVFVRGSGRSARLWLRDSTERRLTSGQNTERSPAAHGDRIAYVQITDDGRRLCIYTLSSKRDTTIVSDRNPEWPAWSPDGKQILFATSGARGGVFVTDSGGRYVNLATTTRGEAAWHPQDATIVVAERTAEELGYNGDPNRLGDRESGEASGRRDRLLTLTAPAAPSEGSALSADVRRNRAERNAEVFDRAFARLDRAYFSGATASRRAQLLRVVRDRYRQRAVAAPNDSVLDQVLHEALRQRPTYAEPASGHAAVSSAHPVATAAGVEILAKGGNAVDAAVAVSFALGVVEPDASGVGGYGEMLVHRSGASEPSLIEFMARAPEEASLANAALMVNGRYPSDGPVLPMVPGTVAGMHKAWQQHGSKRVTWADLIAPAIRAARNGYAVSDGFATTLALEQHRYAKYESSRAQFFRDGKPLAAGDTIKNPDLAWVLEQIAARGADGFYRGEVARRMVEDLRGKGNAIRLTDMSRYFAAERDPVATTYRGHTVFSSAPPASGGSTLSAQLNLFEQFQSPKLYTEDVATLHAMLAAWQLVPSSRGRVADPSLWPTNTEPFTSKDTARVRWRCYDPTRAIDPRTLTGDTLRCGATASNSGGPSEPSASDEERPQGTTAFVVADKDGNVVAVTQTLGTWGGNFYVTPGLGFLYNDKLTSYGTDPGAYGARLPNARHGSTLAPTIVYRGTNGPRTPRLAVGAAGNAWITAAVYQSLIAVIDFGLDAQQALELPRFLPSSRSASEGVPSVDIEDGIAPSVALALKRLGYRVNPISFKGELRMGYGALIVIDGNRVSAGAEPRRSGTAGAVP
ncbi:MAG: gamma-glutamyltransferase [Gemmatimonadaceae bacterium]